MSARLSGPADGPAYWFIFSGPKLLLRGGPTIEAPFVAAPEALGLALEQIMALGQFLGRPAFCAQAAADAPAPEGMFWRILLGLDQKAGPELFWKAGEALYAQHWLRRSRHCGLCGGPTSLAPDEEPLVMRCQHCGGLHYPRLSPAVIVAIEHEGRILLANNRRHPPQWFSVLAGFVAPGESLEHAVQREVAEEVGLAVADIEYFGSQPWPFPDSLMVAFRCRALDDQIRVDGKEIGEARWFAPPHMPSRPHGVTIAARLIDDYLARHGG
ncbi:NAD(+) diphosphatase [Desulfarculus baarsii DSM 2075]|uniref:NAD(+) diphosphatase n=1 Tax=Desulfarculus baarsii (strain ATCC 33931 / DSM 2075 / LMG 7858 / VKM B-1802 / 2st14) TaxID=644282 RepID=E1QE56_DESB2|nr:NAD(+) diphosphatase [Desulfarculus baarsii]ADK83842.1 NAD(+) diphosphatase [Desulfarculus baarsii DSM 2075]